MGITLPLIIPKRRRHLSFGNSLFQKADSVDKELACVNVSRVHFAEMKDIYMFKTTSKFIPKLYAL